MEEELLEIIDNFYREYLIEKYFRRKGKILYCGYILYKLGVDKQND